MRHNNFLGVKITDIEIKGKNLCFKTEFEGDLEEELLEHMDVIFSLLITEIIDYCFNHNIKIENTLQKVLNGLEKGVIQ